MGIVRKAFEFTAPRTGEYLGRLEDRWASEDISTLAARVFEGIVPEEVRSTYARELIHSSGGMRLQPRSAEESEALTMAFRLRFAEWLGYYNELSNYDLDSGDPDFDWQQLRLDQVDRILQGYVNLIVATNFDSANSDIKLSGAKLDRVEQFLLQYESEIVRAFESHGGAPAFYAKTKGLNLSEGVGRRIFDTLAELDNVIEPIFATPNGAGVVQLQRRPQPSPAFDRRD